jgi:hypothetical protein
MASIFVKSLDSLFFKADGKRRRIAREELRATFEKAYPGENIKTILEQLHRAFDSGQPDKGTLVLEGVVSPVRPDDSGVLIESTALVCGKHCQRCKE